MIFYDFEVFKYDWLVVFIDTDTRQTFHIINDSEALRKLYEANIKNIWVGFNNKHYDQYIFKSILLGMNPKTINDKIIVEGLDGWQISREFNKIYMINYDVFLTKSSGLKTLEGFMGNNIKETSVPFNIDRKLTQKEIEETIKYCTSDVENTVEVFMNRIDDFNASYSIIKNFNNILSLLNIGDSKAQLTAAVLQCERRSYEDEFDFFVLPCIDIKKYKEVIYWFEECRKEAEKLDLNHADDYAKKLWYKSKSFTTDITGVPHTFGFGGCHGAPNDAVHYKSGLFHVDVNNYYPSFLLAHEYVTRSATNNNYDLVYKTRKKLKQKQQAAKSREKAKQYKAEQLPYKTMLNSLSGAMKDKNNPAYDPRNNNIMCINGQLMLLDLIEHLEAIPGFILIQSNTDGLIIKIPDTDEAFEMLDDICYDWECRMSTDKCDIGLATDQLFEIFQKDVNNYLWIDIDGGVERIGAYVKELSPLDYDLPIINEALVNYMVNKTPIEKTINECDSFIKFQKLVKLTDKYEYVKHNDIRYDYKCYRVFASIDPKDGKILKVKNKLDKKTNTYKLVGEKFGNTPDQCFIENGDVNNMTIPAKLDRQYYINLTKKRLHDFGL